MRPLNTTIIKLGLIFAACYLSFDIAGQVSNFFPGEVTIAGVSEKGYINILSPQEMSKGVEFKASLNDKEVQRYTPLKVSDYSVDNEVGDFRTIQHTFISESGNSMTEKRFAKILFNGEKLSLFRLDMSQDEYAKFQFTDHPGYVYYLQDNSVDKFYKLEVKEVTYSNTSYKIVNEYQGVLKYVFRDWGLKASLFEKVKFTDRSISRLLEEYHLSAGAKVVKSYGRKKRRLKSSVLANVGFMPLALRREMNHHTGYLAELKYSIANPLKNLTSLQVGIDYITIDYALAEMNDTERPFLSLGQGPFRTFTGFSQVRATLGFSRELASSNAGNALNVRGGIAIGRRNYKNQKRDVTVITLPDGSTELVSRGLLPENLQTETVALNFGLTAEFSRFIIDIGLETVTYGTEGPNVVPVLKVGRSISLGRQKP